LNIFFRGHDFRDNTYEKNINVIKETTIRSHFKFNFNYNFWGAESVVVGPFFQNYESFLLDGARN
jgi:hypothetical protein